MPKKIPIRRFVLAAILTCFVLHTGAQQVAEPDTSEYLPLIFNGALEYNLTIAAASGYSSEIERLIKAGADVDAKSSQGATPLFFAIINKRAEAVKTLVDYGANVNELSLYNENPLLLAINVNDLHIAEILIRNGADVNFKNRAGVTPLHVTSVYGLLELTDLLLYYDAEVDAKDNDGTTPLMAAVWTGYSDVTGLLIVNGANMESRDNEGFTPFLIAAQNGDTLIMNMLADRGVDIYARNIYNWDALALAIKSNHVKAAEFLLKKGNRWHEEARESVNPYNIAAKYGRTEILELLEREKVPGRYKPRFDQMALSFSSRFNGKDFYSGMSLSFKEPLSRAGLIAGIDTKLWYTRVLLKKTDDLFFQYFDRSSLVYAGAFREFRLTDNVLRGNIFIHASLAAAYSFGNKLKGTEITPENKLRIMPSASVRWEKRILQVFGGMEYAGSPFYKTGPLWVRIGCSVNFYFDPDRAPGKIIKWY
ncbi:MAG TPA: ankyrin repeat domain-containing protein [Bacteroidales bacterium]|jgi:ankyrin repeat protein|nr:ankyrin repeat domain-containing protein [Bacteroidales bacterium]HQH23500.1 ankyrin repeat domain-containing protein [Bacteroidales bacterium]HQJ83250.1 ankyrin repeat domain-containing protein [Bacteroidales bacterium]